MIKRNYAVIILVDGQGRVLLQKRDNYKEKYANYWAFFGGGIEKSETPEQALKRELKEELNYNLEEVKLFKVIDYKTDDKEGKGYYFIADFEGKIENLSLKEGAGFAFLTKKEISFLSLNLMDCGILKEYFEK